MSKYSFGQGIPTWNGIPMVGGIPEGLTKILFVDYGNGKDGVSEKSNSVNRPFKTIEKAHGLITTNKNEGIALMGSSTHTLTAMLEITKNRMHIFGYDPGGRMYGQNAKISLGVTTAATDIAAMQNTGVRNSFTNVKFMDSNTVTESLYAVAEGGEFTVYSNVGINKSTVLSTALASDLLMNGDSSQFYNCTIGSLVGASERDTAGAGSKQRPNVLFDRETITGKVCRDGLFCNCIFMITAGHVDIRPMYGTNATDIERMLTIRGCEFWNAKLAAAEPAEAIDFGATQTRGEILIKDCTIMNITKVSTAVGVYLDAGSAPAGTVGIAVQAT